jgi:hypothetical protein
MGHSRVFPDAFALNDASAAVNLTLEDRLDWQENQQRTSWDLLDLDVVLAGASLLMSVIAILGLARIPSLLALAA